MNIVQNPLNYVCATSGVRPALADGIATAASVGSWDLPGAAFSAAIAAAASITTTFTIYGVVVSACNVTDEYYIVLYSGADGSEVEVGRTKCCIVNAAPFPGPIPIRTPIIAANSQIKAKIASKLGSGILSLSILYAPVS